MTRNLILISSKQRYIKKLNIIYYNKKRNKKLKKK